MEGRLYAAMPRDRGREHAMRATGTIAARRCNRRRMAARLSAARVAELRRLLACCDQHDRVDLLHWRAAIVLQRTYRGHLARSACRQFAFLDGCGLPPRTARSLPRFIASFEPGVARRSACAATAAGSVF